MCRRQFCTNCDEELIHRDHRRGYESASALGQIIHREGPYQIQYGDIDGYAVKWRDDQWLFRLLEHKQTDQALGRGQGMVLTALAQMIDHLLKCDQSPVSLMEGSGVWIIRGPLEPGGSRRKVDFAGVQVLTNLATGEELCTSKRQQLYDWLNGGPGWTPRKGSPRSWQS